MLGQFGDPAPNTETMQQENIDICLTIFQQQEDIKSKLKIA